MHTKLMQRWGLFAVMTAGVPSAGIMSALAQPNLFETFSTLGSMFAPGTDSAGLDGRIQAKDLLSSHFGMYGWPGQSFDYVIVGGGTAGLAMARRLSEDGTASVAVIEAGGFYEIDGGNATEVPMYLFNYFFDNGHMKNPLFDWYQYTVAQPVCV
jgi:5'-oxoaverantin cyclase/versicolorin B synthase